MTTFCLLFTRTFSSLLNRTTVVVYFVADCRREILKLGVDEES